MTPEKVNCQLDNKSNKGKYRSLGQKALIRALHTKIEGKKTMEQTTVPRCKTKQLFFFF